MVKSFSMDRSFTAVDHSQVESIAVDWVREHVKRNDGITISNIDIPEISFDTEMEMWKIHVVVSWRQGLLGKLFRSFYVSPTEVYLEFDSGGGLRRHVLPKEVISEEHLPTDES